MIHRAILGSVERFFATLLEYHGGRLPLWLAPEQIRILPITDAQNDYAKQLQAKFANLGYRVKVDSRNEKVGYKIREAELQKIPYMCVIGKNEEAEGTLTLRQHVKGDLGVMNFEEAVKLIGKQA